MSKEVIQQIDHGYVLLREGRQKVMYIADKTFHNAETDVTLEIRADSSAVIRCAELPSPQAGTAEVLMPFIPTLDPNIDQ